MFFPQAIATDHNEESDFSRGDTPDVSPHKTEINSQFARQTLKNNTSLNYSTMQNKMLQNTFNPDLTANKVTGSLGIRQNDVLQFVNSNPINTNLDKSRTSLERDHDSTMTGDAIQK